MRRDDGVKEGKERSQNERKLVGIRDQTVDNERSDELCC